MKSKLIYSILVTAIIASMLAVNTPLSSKTFAAVESSKDLAAKVTIRRDNFGVPHILAESEAAAAFAQGYVTAEDHLLEVARLIVKARSEESLYFGESYAENDFLVKELRMYEGAQAGYDKSPPLMKMIFDSFAAGFSRYVEQHRAELPEWVKPISGVDILAHARRVVVFEFDMNLRQIRNASSRQRVAQSVSPHEEEGSFYGSNMWAIGKGRSVSGKGILLGNPHLAWAGSQLFHEIHITVPNKINISGTTLIGIPGVAIGFNENLGWSHTVNTHDSDDVYELTLDATDAHRYQYEGGSLSLKKYDLTIQVKTDKGVETRQKESWWSHYGPVLKWEKETGKAFAYKSANIDEYRFVEQWNQMAKARNLEEFRRALDIQGIPMFNICYADKDGNVFYIFNGRFPDRPQGHDWSGVLPGNTMATEWNNILPAARLPFLINPTGSYVQNSNSAPWYTNMNAVIDRSKFPADLTPNFNGLRTQLSLEIIESDKSISLDEVLRYKYHMKILSADRMKGDLIKLVKGKTIDGINFDEAAKLLESWDNTVSRDSRGSILFVTFLQKYKASTKTIYKVAWDEKRPVTTPSGIGDEAAALKALATAIKEMNQKFGKLDVVWGDVHRLRRGNLDVPIGGLTDEFGAFRIVAYTTARDGKNVAMGGDSYVLAVEFTSPPTAYSIVAYSQTDDPKSPHHNDQSALFAQEKWKRAWFTEADIKKNTERSYRP